MADWTWENVRHALTMLWQGRNPVARVYESIGADFFLAPAPGWLNLGLWDGVGPPDGSVEQADRACRALVTRVASALPRGGEVLDVGNGLGTQDPVIREAVGEGGRLVAVNVTEWQLRVGKTALAEAGGVGVAADAMRLPFQDASFDGVISVEAAFHFRSRVRFFSEARRVLRPGGVLSFSDISCERAPRGLGEAVAGLTQLRVWGMRTSAAVPGEEIVDLLSRAGFVVVEAEWVGEDVIAPALSLAEMRLAAAGDGVSAVKRQAAGVMLRQVERLWRGGVIEYLLITARAPGSAD